MDSKIEMRTQVFAAVYGSEIAAAYAFRFLYGMDSKIHTLPNVWQNQENKRRIYGNDQV